MEQIEALFAAKIAAVTLVVPLGALIFGAILPVAHRIFISLSDEVFAIAGRADTDDVGCFCC